MDHDELYQLVKSLEEKVSRILDILGENKEDVDVYADGHMPQSSVSLVDYYQKRRDEMEALKDLQEKRRQARRDEVLEQV